MTQPVASNPQDIPSQARLEQMRARHHPHCLASRPVGAGGLGLVCRIDLEEGLVADWSCPPGCEGYPGIVHGGVISTLMDSAMIQLLFALGIQARTGSLTLRMREPVTPDAPVRLVARLDDSHPPLYRAHAELWQGAAMRARAQGKFMSIDPTR